MTVEQARGNLDWILPHVQEAIHKGNYKAPPVRRVFIPKADGDQRPIGVPTIIDRAVQAAMSEILSQIYEQDFMNCSFGFRKGLSCHHAVATLGKIMDRDKTNFVLEVDIRDFFGTLDHKWLRKFLQHRIGDKRVLELIDAWLKAGVMEKDQWYSTNNGTPQGGSISPLLSNIYLHYVLDLWWEKKIRKRTKGKAYLVRYCDDFAMGFEHREEAEKVLSLLKARFAQFGLTIAEEKTGITAINLRERDGNERRTVKFLGFSISRAKSRKDNSSWRMVYRTDRRRFSRSVKVMKHALYEAMHWKLEDQAKRINAILRGHFNYYGLPGNSEKLSTFRIVTTYYWRRVLSRRSQKGSVNWEQMSKILERYPLVPANLRLTYATIGAYQRVKRSSF